MYIYIRAQTQRERVIYCYMSIEKINIDDNTFHFFVVRVCKVG